MWKYRLDPFGIRNLQATMEQAMTIMQDLVDAVKKETDEAIAAKMALNTLQNEVMALQAKAAVNTFDPSVIQKAIADLGASAADLGSAIPAAPAPAPVAAAAPAADPAPVADATAPAAPSA